MGRHQSPKRLKPLHRLRKPVRCSEEGGPSAEAVERLRQEPDVVVQELIAGLDAWVMERRQQKRPEVEWRRLFQVADRLDRSGRSRRLRASCPGLNRLFPPHKVRDKASAIFDTAHAER